MTAVFCSVDERYANPLFEVFDGGDFVLSSYRDVEDDATTMQIFFPDPADEPVARTALQAALDIVGVTAEMRVRTFPDTDWTLSYRLHFKTEVLSPRLAIVPEWETYEPTAGQQVIRLDPGMAFGTGKHETTHACLEFIDRVCAEGAPETFLDVGTGSGILAIAAEKLGCRSVRGFDLDPDAVNVARASGERNGSSVCFFRGDLTGKGPHRVRETPADFVAANVLGPILIRFAAEIAALVKPGGRLILSGILADLYPEVRSAYEALDFAEDSAILRGEWKTGLFVKSARA